MKTEETMSPEELGEKGYYGNNGQWVMEVDEIDEEKYPEVDEKDHADHDLSTCEECGAEVDKIRDGYTGYKLCQACYEDEKEQLDEEVRGDKYGGV